MSALANLAARYVHKAAWLTTERGKHSFSVKVIDIRVSYGRYEFLVEPLDGSGSAWISHNRISQIETGESAL